MAKKSASSIGSLIDLPSQIYVGYLPDMAESDALNFIETQSETLGFSLPLTYFGLYPFESGFIYEIHEAGSGLGFMDSIIEYFATIPQATLLSDGAQVTLQTKERLIKLDFDGRSLACMVLPESSTELPSEFVKLNKKLKPLFNSASSVMTSGLIMFFSGLVVLLGGFLVQKPTYVASSEKFQLVKVDPSQNPYSVWIDIQARKGVKSVKYDKSSKKFKVTYQPDSALPLPVPPESLAPVQDAIDSSAAMLKDTAKTVSNATKTVVDGAKNTLTSEKAAQLGGAPSASNKSDLESLNKR